MRIGVISDTHIPGRAKALPAIVMEALSEADHIIHAGDIKTMEVLSLLESLAPLTAVAGNADPLELRKTLGDKKVVSLGGFDIGVFHGHGAKGKTLRRAIECFKGGKVDCIVFGHSHMPYCGYHDGVLLFNPGSPTDKRRNTYYSFGLLDAKNIILPSIIYFNSQGIVAVIKNDPCPQNAGKGMNESQVY